MKTLHLPLKAQWYDMIESGEKKEEYREITKHWSIRISNCVAFMDENGDLFYCDRQKCPDCLRVKGAVRSHQTHVCFRYGYTKRTMLFKLDSITIGKGRPEWGAPDHNVFILKLGERIE